MGPESTVHYLLVHRHAQHTRPEPHIRTDLHRRHLHRRRMPAGSSYTHSRHHLVLGQKRNNLRLHPAIEATSSTIVCCSRWWARRLRCHHILLADLENRTSSLLRQGYPNLIRAQHRNQKKTPQIDKVCPPATRRETHFRYLTQFWVIVQG